MYSDPFMRLGVSRDCTQGELTDAFNRLKSKYQKDLFLEGETGAKAAKDLDEIKIAYDEALMLLANNYTINGGGVGGAFSDVEQLIKEGNLDEAQKKLDFILERGAQWHYTQAIIFYKKSWLMESRKQLVLAVQLEPSNPIYNDTLKRLEDELMSKNPFTNVGNNQGNSRSYTDPNPRQTTGGSGDACCNTCQTLICADCCCECMGGDCISCC